MHATHNERSIRQCGVAAMQMSRLLNCCGYVTVPPFAAKFVTVSPYAGNGLLRNFESFSPYRHGNSTALVRPIRMPLTISGLRARA